MATPTRKNIDDLRGAARLAVDATIGITDLVEKMHHTIQLGHLPLGASRADVTGGLTGLIYRSIRGTTRVVGRGLDMGLAPVAAMLPEGESTAARDAWVSAINGVYGDHLVRTENPLAIDMSFRHDGARVDPQRPADTLTGTTGRLLVIVHGLCLNEQHWTRDGDNRIEAVAVEHGYTPVYLRYNSGRSIATNGREFAEQLETLLCNWPQPVTGGRDRRPQHGRARREERGPSWPRGSATSGCARCAGWCSSARRITAHRSSAAAIGWTT